MAYASQSWTKKLLGQTLKSASEQGLIGSGSEVGYEKYSEEEIIVGEWIDGKPLYRKVVNISNLPNNTGAKYPHNIENVDMIYISDGYLKTSTEFITIPSIDPSSVAAGVLLRVDINDILIEVRADRRSWSSKIILQYTKTTDEPGSFTPAKIDVSLNDAPIGTVISYMGTTAPKDYLICDGTEHNISLYPELAEHIKKDFGSYNHFGGDGVTTFAVPDLRGEFLRGSGENGHTSQGNGGEVGEHQDGTKHRNIGTYENGIIYEYSEGNINTEDILFNADSGKYRNGYRKATTANFATAESTNIYGTYTSRPTNTSVLYCIKYTSTVNSIDTDYSEEETFTGKRWIDGKPIYRKVFHNTDKTKFVMGDSNLITVGNIGSNIDSIIKFSTIIGGINDNGQIDAAGSWQNENCAWIKCQANGDITINSLRQRNEYYIRTMIVEYTKK